MARSPRLERALQSIIAEVWRIADRSGIQIVTDGSLCIITADDPIIILTAAPNVRPTPAEKKTHPAAGA